MLHKCYRRRESETVGIRELRQNASEIISAAEAGQVFHVTVRGKDTGVVITKQPSTPQPTPAGYEKGMLEIVERGRDESGRVGARDQ